MPKKICIGLSSIITLFLMSGCGTSSNRSDFDDVQKKTGAETGADAPPPICHIEGVSQPIPSGYKAGEIATLCDQAIAKMEDRMTSIASLKKEDQTIDNTILAFESAQADFSDQTMPLTFMGYVSTDTALSKEGSACEEKVGQFSVDIYTRRPLYKVLAGQTTNDVSQLRLLTQTLLSFEQNGLKLSDAGLAKVKDLKSKLATKENKFSTNLNTDNTSVIFTQQQLAGATADFLARLKKSADGKFIVTTKSTDYLDLMQNVIVANSRKKMLLAYLNRGGSANTKLLEEAVVLRSQIAETLGYANWADARTAPRMVKTSANALEFLNNLKGKLAVRNQQDQDQLLRYKKELDPKTNSLDQWDIAFLTYQLEKRDYNLDNEKIREYFPAETVIAGIFDVYSKLLGVQFVEAKNGQMWAEGVKLYEIHDATDCRLIGYFYTDLIPRPGKYGHAAAFPLISGRILGSETYNYPVSSIVANFTPPTEGKPSLLTHDEVNTFFHEFGHIMHQTLTKAPYASLSGSSVAQDFVEAPSQMLENWVWDAKILNLISGHYLRPEEKLPQDLLEKMLAARNFQQGATYTKQLLYALFDLTLHTQNKPVDVTKTYNDLYRKIIGQEPVAGNHFAASFGHLMGGYDAGYYGYLWSEVYAQDMFSEFSKTGDLTNPAMGSRYRKGILEQGNMRDAIVLLKEFLGREPSNEAFFKKLGL